MEPHTPTRPELLAGQQLPPPPRQERSRLKREALLRAALELFAERGYEETSVEAIGQRAGVAVGGFYQHFASKRQLLLVLMDQLLQAAAALAPQASPEPPPEPAALIELLVRQGLQLDWAFAGAFRAWLEAALRDRELGALHLQIERWMAAQLEAMLRALAQFPGARPEADIPMLSWTLTLLFFRLAEAPVEEPARADALVATLRDLIYHALFQDGA